MRVFLWAIEFIFMATLSRFDLVLCIIKIHTLVNIAILNLNLWGAARDLDLKEFQVLIRISKVLHRVFFRQQIAQKCLGVAEWIFPYFQEFKQATNKYITNTFSLLLFTTLKCNPMASSNSFNSFRMFYSSYFLFSLKYV